MRPEAGEARRLARPHGRAEDRSLGVEHEGHVHDVGRHQLVCEVRRHEARRDDDGDRARRRRGVGCRAPHGREAGVGERVVYPEDRGMGNAVGDEQRHLGRFGHLAERGAELRHERRRFRRIPAERHREARDLAGRDAVREHTEQLELPGGRVHDRAHGV
ncbi:hypothetical protein GCM10010922_19810 [Microbacterium sorbitolivorans]|nr:hypothetical protein GCM10010922_19810 [Microbacterium sorbitolivorans]